MTLTELLKFMARKEASDLHLKPMRPPLVRIRGKLIPVKTDPLTTDGKPELVKAFRFARSHPRGTTTEVRDLFHEWLLANFPDRYRHVFKLIRDMRGGKDYDAKWGERMTGSGPIAWMIGRRFEAACEKLGLNAGMSKLTTDHFAPPHRRGCRSPSCSPSPPGCSRTPPA